MSIDVTYKYTIEINISKIFVFSFFDTLFICSFNEKLSTIYPQFRWDPLQRRSGWRSRWNNYGINNNERRLYGGGTNAVGGKKRVWEKWLISNLLEGVYCHPLRWIETVTEKPRVILYVGGLALALFAIVYL